MTGAARVHLFSSGGEYMTWRYNNCARCSRLPNCDLEESIASACVLDGTISQEVASRLGVPADGRERWWCQELTVGRPPQPEPVSAAEEMTRAGANRLPGMET